MSEEPKADAEGAEAPAGGEQAVAPGPDEEPTGKHDLGKLAARLAKERRRHTSAELSFKRKGKQEVRIPLDRGSTVIGRDARCDIVLADEGVSRRHARVVKNERGLFELVDMSSTNGTLVEGLPLGRMVLCDGDRFTVGDTRFTVHLLTGEE